MKSEVIANPRAERVRRVSELADRKGRKRSGRFMVEGPQSVRELLSWHPDIVEDLYVEVVSAEPDAAFITPTVAQMAGKAMQAGAYVHKVTHAVMQHMSSDAQGVLAVATCALSSIPPSLMAISTNARWSPRSGRCAIRATPAP